MNALAASPARVRSSVPLELKSAGEYEAEVLREFGYSEAADAAEERRRLQFTYAAFPTHLKAAMKTAAANYGWCRATWAMQTQMIADAMLAGRDTDDNIAARYGAPKQHCPWAD